MRSPMNGPPNLTYFADRDLGRQFPELLRAAGIRIERHDDHFGVNTPDDEWLFEITRRGWVAVTRDQRINYSPLAKSVMMEAGARLFVLVGNMTVAEAATNFLRWQGPIEALALLEFEGFIAKVRRDGIHVWVRRVEWLARQKK